MIDIDNPICPFCNYPFLYPKEMFSARHGESHVSCIGQGSPHCPVEFTIRQGMVTDITYLIKKNYVTIMRINAHLQGNTISLFLNNSMSPFKVLPFVSIDDLKKVIAQYSLLT